MWARDPICMTGSAPGLRSVTSRATCAVLDQCRHARERGTGITRCPPQVTSISQLVGRLLSSGNMSAHTKPTLGQADLAQHTPHNEAQGFWGPYAQASVCCCPGLQRPLVHANYLGRWCQLSLTSRTRTPRRRTCAPTPSRGAADLVLAAWVRLPAAVAHTQEHSHQPTNQGWCVFVLEGLIIKLQASHHKAKLHTLTSSPCTLSVENAGTQAAA